MYTMISNVAYKASLETLISKDAANDEFISFYKTFDAGVKIALAGMPTKYFARDSYNALQELVKMLCRDDLPVSDHLAERHECLKKSLGMSKEDIAKDDLLWAWAAVTNLVPSQFWNLYFILSDSDAMEAVKEEVDTIMGKRKTEDGPFDGTFTLEELDSMVRIESAIKEAIRLSFGGLVMRVIMQDMTIDLKRVGSKISTKYFLEKDSSIMFHVPVLHKDPTIFESPDEYRWNRFLPDPDTGRAPTFQASSGEVIVDPFRGFGGGSHYCPGRKLAMYIGKSLVAHMIYTYDMNVIGSTGYDMELDSVGTLRPQDSVELELNTRKK